MNMGQLGYEYGSGQVDLACLDTMSGDYEEYAACLRFRVRCETEAIHQMFAANGAVAFEQHERETRDERYARWGIA
jgi:hypothetical protein